MEKKKVVKISVYSLFTLFILMLFFMQTVSADFYNTTNITNANNIFEQTAALNNIVHGIIGYGFLAVAVIITFTIITGNYDVIAGLGAAGFIGALSSTIMVPLGLIPFFVYQKVIIVFGVIVLITFLMKR